MFPIFCIQAVAVLPEPIMAVYTMPMDRALIAIIASNPCEACGYIESERGSLADVGHDSLCCGSKTCTATEAWPCYTHLY